MRYNPNASPFLQTTTGKSRRKQVYTYTPLTAVTRPGPCGLIRPVLTATNRTDDVRMRVDTTIQQGNPHWTTHINYLLKAERAPG